MPILSVAILDERGARLPLFTGVPGGSTRRKTEIPK